MGGPREDCKQPTSTETHARHGCAFVRGCARRTPSPHRLLLCALPSRRRYGLELGSSVGDLPTADVLISWSEAIIRQWDVLTGDKMIRRDILEELSVALL